MQLLDLYSDQKKSRRNIYSQKRTTGSIAKNRLNEIENALEIFLLANQRLPSEPSILCNLGIAYKNLDNISEARDYFNKAININPRHLPSHINLGHLENNLNHSEKAADHYLTAYRLNNNSEEALTYLILSLSAQGKFDEAKKIIAIKQTVNIPNKDKIYFLKVIKSFVY